MLMGFSSCAKSEEARSNVRIVKVVRICVIEILEMGGGLPQTEITQRFPISGSCFILSVV
jgi:hypothetical protein